MDFKNLKEFQRALSDAMGFDGISEDFMIFEEKNESFFFEKRNNYRFLAPDLKIFSKFRKTLNYTKLHAFLII